MSLNNEIMDPDIVDLLGNINIKANTLQNAGLYALFKSAIKHSNK